MCCGIIYKGRFGEVLIDPHLFKPCCRNKQRQQQQQQEDEEDEEEDEEEEEEGEEVEVEEGQVGVDKSHVVEEVVKETPTGEENAEAAKLCVTAPPARSREVMEEGW